MDAAKCRIKGSDYTGVFCTASDNFVLAPLNLTPKEHSILSGTLHAKIIEVSVAESGLVGLFAKANSNGVILSNLATEQEAEAIRPVGDRYVLEEMQRIGSNLGGEQSGHILFLDDATTGDGMLTAVKIASIVSICGPLGELTADLKVFPQKIVNVRVKSKPALDSLPAVARKLQEANYALRDRGRVVLRYSGTEPLARVMVEAEEQRYVDQWVEALVGALQSSIGV